MPTRQQVILIFLATLVALYLLNWLSGGQAIRPVELLGTLLTGALGNGLWAFETSFANNIAAEPAAGQRELKQPRRAAWRDVLTVASTQCFALLMVNIFVALILSNLKVAQTMGALRVTAGREHDVEQFFIGMMFLAVWTPWATWLGAAFGRSRERLFVPMLLGAALGWLLYQIVIHAAGADTGIGDLSTVFAALHAPGSHDPGMLAMAVATRVAVIGLTVCLLAAYPWIIAWTVRIGSSWLRHLPSARR